MNPDDTEELKNRPAYAKAKAQADAEAAKPAALSLETLTRCLITAKNLSEASIARRQRLLGNWLCEADLGYVFAPRGLGKTWFAMALLSAISMGRKLGKWDPGEIQTKALYVDGEMPLELTKFRSQGMCLSEGDITYLHHEMIFDMLGTSINIGKAEHRQITTELLVSQGFKCLVMDNLSSLASGIEENRGEDYEPISHWLLELRRRKITVIMIHHAGRNTEVMRGHSKREDACSWIIQLIDAKKEGDSGAKFISHFSKPSRNTGDAMADLLWHFTTKDDGSVSIDCDFASNAEFDIFVQHVLDGMETISDVADHMKKNKGTISKWAKKAEAMGRIKKQGNRLLPPSNPTKSRTDPDDD